MQPLVIAHHLIWTIYGYWLPNDLRGSMSKTIRNDVIAELGALHFGRKKIQPASRDIRAFAAKATPVLRFPILAFGRQEGSCIADAFRNTIARCRYTCYACAIMPDHIHILIRKHKHDAEEMIRNLQRESHLALRERGLRDMEHPVWGGPGWKVFLDCPEDVSRTIRYVEDNPIKIGLSKQRFDFVKAYNNWPLHDGHDPNSPYARRLRRRGD